MSININDAIRPIVVHWILDSLASFQAGIKWDALKAMVAARVMQIVPNQALDVPIDHLLDEIIDGIHAACADQADEAALVNACMSKQWPQAMAALKALLAKVVAPTMAQKALLAIL